MRLAERRVLALGKEEALSFLYKQAILAEQSGSVNELKYYVQVLRKHPVWGDEIPELGVLEAFLVFLEGELGRSQKDSDFIELLEGDDLHRDREILPIEVICHNLRSTWNVGSVMRSAEFFGANKVWLTGFSPSPDPRTSLGSENMIEWEKVSDLNSLEKGAAWISLETAADAVDLYDFSFPKNCVLLLGNERKGLDQEALAMADHILRIPMRGKKNSLNVATSFSVVISEYVRQWS